MNIKSLGLTELSQAEQKKVSGGVVPLLAAGLIALFLLLGTENAY